MTAKKYKQGKQIRTISDFDQSDKKWYIVRFGSEVRTRNRAVLMALQYRTLLNFIINGHVYEAERIENA